MRPICMLVLFTMLWLFSCASQPEVSPVLMPVIGKISIIEEPLQVDEELSIEKLDASLKVAYLVLAESIPQNGRIAILGITADDPGAMDFISQEIISLLVANRNKSSKNYSVVDRNNLELLRKEQELQASGDISDESVVSLGKWLGATHVITGSLVKIQHWWTLNLRNLSVETSEIIGVSNEHL